MSILPTRIQSMVQNFPGVPAANLARNMLENGLADEDIEWLLTNAIKVEQARLLPRGGKERPLIPTSETKPQRDPRAQRVIDDFTAKRRP